MSNAKYLLRFFFDGGCLWPGNDAAHQDFDLGPYDTFEPCPLPLSTSTLECCQRLNTWYDTTLNQDYPPDPSPWRQPECDRFNAAVIELLASVRHELGSAFEVVNEQASLSEDPDLDSYLANPRGFKRRN